METVRIDHIKRLEGDVRLPHGLPDEVVMRYVELLRVSNVH
jgi:hypothetical protein